MIIALHEMAILVVCEQLSMNNSISHNERNIFTTASAMVSGLTSDYDDRVLHHACYHATILGSDKYQFNHFGSKSYEFPDR